MANAQKIVAAGGLVVPIVSADPSSPEDGTMWYNSTAGAFKKRESGSTVDLGAGETIFDDGNFKIVDEGGDSLGIVFDVSAVTSADKTLTFPDSNVDLADIATNSVHVAGDGSDHADVAANTADIADLRTTQGTSDGDTDLGTFTGSTISDSATVKSGMQELETAVEGKIGAVSEDSSPSLGGDLTLGANAVIHDGDGMKLGDSSSTFMEHEYISSTTLTANTTAVASNFTFAHASFAGAIFEYQITQASTGAIRVGHLMVCSDGSTASITDSYTELSDIEISWSAAINGADVEISYDNAHATNDCTMKCMMKRLQV